MPELQIVRPSAPATAGNVIQLHVNAYKVSLPSNIIYHYDLAIEGLVGKGGVIGDVPPKFGRELFAHLRDTTKAFGNARPIYDGRKNLFSNVKFDWPDNRRTFSVDLSVGKNTRKFKIVLVQVNDIKLDNLRKYVNRQAGSVPDEGVYNAINALNVLCNHDLMMLHPNARNKFFPKPSGVGDQMKILKGGIEMWRGYFSSIRMVLNGAILNFDLSSQPMIRSGNLAEVAAEIAGLGGRVRELLNLKPQQITHLTRALRGIRVTVTRADGSKFRAKPKALGPLNAMTHTFTIEEEGKPPKKTTIQAFFKSHYNVDLRGPELPVIQLSAKAWYPLELCMVEPGQKYIKKLEPEQLSDAIKWLTVKPGDRTQMLSEGVARHLATSVTPSQWGLKFDARPMMIKARRLPPPTVNHFNNGKKETTPVQNGVWNMAGKKVFQAAPPLKNWVAVAFTEGFRIDHQQVMKILGDLRTSMINSGLVVEGGPPPVYIASRQDQPVRSGDGKDDEVGRWIMSKLKCKPQLIVCFLKDKNAWQYRQLKIFGDSAQGVPSQCMAIDKVLTKGNAQYYANVTLKINAKLGGMNHVIGATLPFLQTPSTMIMGADVTHPGADSMEPSIAGVVASTNVHGLGYAADFAVQPGRQEIIGELDVLAGGLLRKFHDRSGHLPKRIIFYRDGVSEGQFPQVLAQEIPLLRKAIAGVQSAPQYKASPSGGPITLTFIVCGKRHHFKFGPVDARKDGDRNGNCLPGVVVDSGITHPFDFDWYGLSHAGLLGTSRSAHYTVLIDDAKHSADSLQTLTYHLCYLYSRATRSVSIATPAYYAHHICTRIKQFLSGLQVTQASTLTPTQVDLDRALGEYRNKAATYKAGFNSVYIKNRLTNPVPEYWM